MITRAESPAARPQKTSERLEERARKPFTYNRDLLRKLAERFRAIEALEADPEARRRVVGE